MYPEYAFSFTRFAQVLTEFLQCLVLADACHIELTVSSVFGCMDGENHPDCVLG